MTPVMATRLASRQLSEMLNRRGARMTDHPQRDEISTLAGQPLDQLCQEVLERHHAPAHIAVPRIRGRVAALLERELGAVDPALQGAFGDLSELLVGHLVREENILFRR